MGVSPARTGGAPTAPAGRTLAVIGRRVTRPQLSTRKRTVRVVHIAPFTLLNAALLALAGCGGVSYSSKAANGIVYYVPGAGNVDFGDAGVRSGLAQAGFKGEVAAYPWTISFNPAIDQTLRFNARLRARGLARIIEDYIDEYPGCPVSLVGLSAGTGISIWALEDLKEGYQVDNVILLSSSLWHQYDVSKALRRVKGKIYVYYSSNDAILAGPMKVFGTIDGVFGEDGAGAVGLHTPRGKERVVNIRWRPEFENLGYFGGHTDSTAAPFVRAVLAKHLLSDAPSADRPNVANETAVASPRAKAPPAANRD